MSIFAKRPRASFADRLGNYPPEDDADDGIDADAEWRAELAEAGFTPESYAKVVAGNAAYLAALKGAK